MISPGKYQLPKKTKSEWVEFVREFWTERRIWIHERPERAVVVSFVSGMALVIALFLFFRLFISLVLIVSLVAFVVWYLAPPP